jgi:ABC-type nitrate/sulfonate/bicarbonate transport system substrate-binding protein
MKNLLLIMIAVSTAACATVQPYKAASTSSKEPSDAFDCALGLATSLNYAPEQVSKESGFFKAEHNYRPGASSIRWGASMTDALTVLITKQGTVTSIQVTGTSGANAGRNLRLIESSTEVVDAANKIVQNCK